MLTLTLHLMVQWSNTHLIDSPPNNEESCQSEDDSDRSKRSSDPEEDATTESSSLLDLAHHILTDEIAEDLHNSDFLAQTQGNDTHGTVR